MAVGNSHLPLAKFLGSELSKYRKAEAKRIEKERLTSEKLALDKAKMEAKLSGGKEAYKAMLKKAREDKGKKKATTKKQPTAGHSEKVFVDVDAGADSMLLPPAWRSLEAGFFEQEEDFPKVLLSYQSSSTGKNVGKTWMWAVANGFRKAKVTSFNGYQVGPGHRIPFGSGMMICRQVKLTFFFACFVEGYWWGELAGRMVRSASRMRCPCDNA